MSEEAAALVVTSVAADSPYYGKLQADLVILEINKSSLQGVDQAKALLQPGRNLLMVFADGQVKPMALTVK